MSCISQAPSLATTLTSNPSQVVISTPHGPVPNSPATSASRSWTPLTFPLATSPAGKETVATTGVMVVASSMHAPDAEFYQLALAESVDPRTHTLSLPLTPPPSQKDGSIHHHQQQPQQPAHPQPALPQQCAAPPSPPSSTIDLEEDASVLHISTHQPHVRAPPQQKKVLVANRDAPLPPMRRTAKPRFRRKPLPRVQAPAPQPLRAPTPPPSLPSPPKQAGLVKGKNPQWRRAAVINDVYFQRWQANGLCLIAPVGTCPIQADGNNYCKMHSCQAMLADRTLCGEAVYTPQDGRYCEGGYHEENQRLHELHELILRRAADEFDEVARREQEWAAHLDYFDHKFGEAVASPHAYQFNSDAKPIPQGPGANLERMWGAHADDKWWVGEWRPLPPRFAQL